MKTVVTFANGEVWDLTEDNLTAKAEKAGEPVKTVRDMLEMDFDTTFPEGEEPIVLINGEPGSLDHEIEDRDEIEFPELPEPEGVEEG